MSYNSVLEALLKQVWALLGIGATYLLSLGIYNVYFHPLSQYPGPKLWAATRSTYVRSLWSGKLATDVRDLHLKYGDVVRIAPDEISFARPDAFHDIYANQPGRPAFPKSKLWHGAAPGRPISVLNALDPKIHSRIRKAMDPAFTERAVRAQEAIINLYVSSLLSHLQDLVSTDRDGAIINIVRWYGFVTFDLIGDLGFGESFECLQRSEFHPWVSMIFNSLRAATYRASLRYYPSLDWLLKFAIPKSVMKKQMEHWQLSVDKVNRRLNLEKERPDLISLIKQDESGKDGLTLPELQATSSVIIVAGSETTVSVLSGTTNYLVKNSDKLAHLVAEIRGAFQSESDITLTALKDTTYLNAVIQEGLRLCNPTPVGLPRIVPPGGGMVSGYSFPENTFVNVHPLTLSLSSKFFHDPQGFHPERWIVSSTKDASSPFYTDNLDAVQAFGVGPRSCIGKPLALAELRLILARLVWRFDLEEVDTLAGKIKWDEQRVFTVVERKPFEVRLKLRRDLPQPAST